MLKIRRSDEVSVEAKAINKIPLELQRKDFYLASGGSYIEHMVSPELPEQLSKGSSITALRQALLMKMVGAKYAPADAIGYSYAARTFGANSALEGVLGTQRWEANSVVWVEYGDIGPDLTMSTLRLAYELSGNPDEVSTRLFYLLCDMRNISEVGLANYLQHCRMLDWLTKTDRLLLMSTFSVFRGAVRVYGDGESPEWARVVVHSVGDDGKVAAEEVEASRRVSPLFDGYVLDVYLNLSGEVVNKVDRLVEKRDSMKNVWGASRTALLAMIPGWVTVIGLRNATPERLAGAIARALEDASAVLDTLESTKTLRDAASALQSVGSLERLANAVLARYESGAPQSDEEVVDWLRSEVKDERILSPLVEFLKALSAETSLPLVERRFWEYCASLEKGNKVLEILPKVARRLTNDERVEVLVRDFATLVARRRFAWNDLRTFLSRGAEDLAPFVVLRVGEELGVGARMDEVYEYAVPGELGESLARLYRRGGVVVPVTMAVEGGGAMLESTLRASKHLDILLPYAAFYSFGLPIMKVRNRFGKYERLIPMFNYLAVKEFGRPLDVSLYRVSDGAVTRVRVVMGVMTELFDFFDKVVIGYINRLREWGRLDPHDRVVYHGLLYLFSGRGFARAETVDDAVSSFVSNYLDLVRGVTELKSRMEGRVKKIAKLNERAREMPEICCATDRELERLVKEGKVSSDDLEERRRWFEWVEDKYSDHLRVAEEYARRVLSAVSNMMTWVQYVHPDYLERAVEATVTFYESVDGFDSQSVERRVGEAIKWLSARSQDQASVQHLAELSGWLREFAERVGGKLSETKIRVGVFEPTSVYSVLNAAPVVTKLMTVAEDAERFRRIMAIVAMIEEERNKEKAERTRSQRVAGEVYAEKLGGAGALPAQLTTADQRREAEEKTKSEKKVQES